MDENTKKAEKIAKLEQRKAAIEAQLNRERNSIKKKERAEDTRKKILAGAWVMLQAEENEQAKQKLMAGLDDYLTAERDRTLFGLPKKAST